LTICYQGVNFTEVLSYKGGIQMEIQFVTDVAGNKTAAIVPFEEWEQMEKAKDLLEHIYLSEIIKKR
jgi:hypothetical protein